MLLMNLKKIISELTVHRLIITFFSLCLIVTVKFFFPVMEKQTEIVQPLELENLEEIEIVELPFVSSILENETVIQAELEYGSNLNNLLLSNGLSRDEANSVVYEVGSFVNLRSMRAGEIFDLKFSDDQFTGLQMIKSDSLIVEVVRDSNMESGFRAFERERKLNTYVKYAFGTIDDNLFTSATDAGITPNILMELIMLLSFDVDFQRDIQKGDTFNVAFETIYDEKGIMVGEGQILSAQLITDGRDISFYYYTDLDGKSDYFNAEGQTIRKTLLKTPINGAYITSGYGMRISPITGYNRTHKGIDFGAPRGTSIYASGDGVIESAYYSEVYGNFIEIRHVNGYRTLYAHMTNYARGMRKGIRVRQGQIIGYVGSTGMSTGPHLHYEISYWGTKVNPRSVKSPPGRSLKGEDLILFDNLKKSYIASFL